MTKKAPVSKTGRKLHLRIRLVLVGIAGDAFGPGKAHLLEQVQKTGTLSEAAALLEMSYMKAWCLAEADTKDGQPLPPSEGPSASSFPARNTRCAGCAKPRQ